LTVLERFLGHVRIRPEASTRLLASDALCATDLAEYLVMRGVAFSDAHATVGKLVALAERSGKRLRDVGLAQLQSVSPHVDRAALAVLDPRRSVERKRSAGSTNPAQVKRALARWRQRLR
jgi:argininosuccinate lyase